MSELQQVPLLDQLRNFLTKENLEQLVNEINGLYAQGHFLPSQACKNIEGINALASIVGIKGFKAAAHPEALALFKQGQGAPFDRPTDRHGHPIDREDDDYEEDRY